MTEMVDFNLAFTIQGLNNENSHIIHLPFIFFLKSTNRKILFREWLSIKS